MILEVALTCLPLWKKWTKHSTLWASSYLLHILARHHSMWDPTGTWGSPSQPAQIQGSTGRWRRCHGWGQGGTCSSSRWWSRAAQSKCRSSAPLLALHCVGRRGENQNGKWKRKNYRYPTFLCWNNENRRSTGNTLNLKLCCIIIFFMNFHSLHGIKIVKRHMIRLLMEHYYATTSSAGNEYNCTIVCSLCTKQQQFGRRM